MADSTHDPVLLLQHDMERPESIALPGGRVALFTRRKPGREGPNEDAAGLIPLDKEHVVLVVADGLGGAPAGATASGIAVESLRDSVGACRQNGGELRDAILDGVESANARITALATGTATTLAAVAVEQDTVRTIHVGDSAILVVGQRGKIKLETVRHSPVGYAVEAGLLAEQEAMLHEERHYVTNTVGSPDMRIEMGSTLRLGRRDTVVVGSDGLFDNLYREEIVERVRKGPLHEAAERLALDCLARMEQATPDIPHKKDDLTFILYRPG
jgi:serine/threonine protein phosphatase PrpC